VAQCSAVCMVQTDTTSQRDREKDRETGQSSHRLVDQIAPNAHTKKEKAADLVCVLLLETSIVAIQLAEKPLKGHRRHGWLVLKPQVRQQRRIFPCLKGERGRERQ
jgi:hypothetical protein